MASKWRIMTILSMMALTGCCDGVESDVTAKLAQADNEPALPVVTEISDETKVIDYQAGANPFDNPVRAYANHIADSAISATAQQQAQSGKPEVQQDTTQANHGQELSNMPNAINNAPPASTPIQPLGEVVAIDTARQREPLEAFELSQLSYQGNVSDGERMIALVKSPDGRVHQVSQGHYVGQHHGRVASITPMAIVIHEALMAADGRYYRRDVVIEFGHK